MPAGSISVRAASAALSANGNAGGYVTVADASAFYPGARAWLSDTTGRAQRCIITDIGFSGANTIGLRFVADNVDMPQTASGVNNGPMYTRSDCSAFTTANGSRIEMDSGVVPIENISTVVKKDYV